MSVIEDLAQSIHELTESLRLSTADPADQIRLLCELASFGIDDPVRDTGQVGIACFRPAGASNVWAYTSRASTGTYIDGQGVVRSMPAKTLRPVFTNGLVSGYLNEVARTNFQFSSADMTSSVYSTGSNNVDLGTVTSPDGTQTARRIRSGPSGPGNVYLARATHLSVLNSRSYMVSCFIRCHQGTVSSGNALIVDEFDSSNALITRNGFTSMTSLGNNWTRYTRTFATTATTAAIQIYWVADWTVGTELEVWGTQVELGSSATSFIYTPVNATAIRSADNITLRSPAELSYIAKEQGIAEAATAALCRRAALASLALAVADYTPASSNEAAGTLRRIMPLYDAEILNAGDVGDMDSYNELRNLRAVVTADLQKRGLQLPEIINVSRSASQPGLVVAHALYEDATRGDELVQRVNPPHPLFFPTKFEAQSS